MELKGKTINFLGDSITEGHCVKDKENNRFDNVIKNRCGLAKVNNYGVGGTRIAHQITPSEIAKHDMNFCERCFSMDKEADIIVVFGGTNDYGHGDAPLGKPTHTMRTTFCGSLNYLCTTIKSDYPNAICVFMTPTHREGDDKISQNQNKPACADRRFLYEYVNMIKEIVPKYGFYVLDLYNELGIDPKKPEDREKYTADGLHFNDAGHIAIAEKLIEFLQNIN